MPNMEIRAWVANQLRPLQEPTFESNALADTFQLSVLRLLSLRITERTHEEPTTGFLLGSMASFAQPCSAAANDIRHACSWQYFSKTASPEDSEVTTGADFALIIQHASGQARLAIFQAKRAIDDTESFTVHQLKKPREAEDGQTKTSRATEIPQFIRLVTHCLNVSHATHKDTNHGSDKGEDQNNDVASSIDTLHWAHYLIYLPRRIQYIPLSRLSSIKNAYSTRTEGAPYPDPGPVIIADHPTKHLFWLLTSGALADGEDEVEGWLNIDGSRLAEMAKRVRSFIDVCVARVDPGPELDLDLDSASATPQPTTTSEIAEDILDKLLTSQHGVAYRSAELAKLESKNNPTFKMKNK